MQQYKKFELFIKHLMGIISNSGINFFLIFFLRAFLNGYSISVQQKHRLFTAIPKLNSPLFMS